MRRFDFVVAGCLVVVAVVHLLPVVGVAGPRQLDNLYGIGSVSDAVGIASTASFIVIATLGGTSTLEIRRVVVIDVAAVGLLAIVAVAETVRRVRGLGAGGEQPASVDHAATSQR